MTRIAFTGLKGSGKSTLASYFVAGGFQELAFADPLKKMIIDTFQIDPKYVYDSAFKEATIPEWGASGRALCQIIGTDLMRHNLNHLLPNLSVKNIWIHQLVSKLNSGDIVVSDCRFPDEYDALHKNGFTVVKIIRDLSVTDSHASEQGCQCDYAIHNNGSIDDLCNMGQYIIDQLLIDKSLIIV